jgi:hypothetical protein
MKTLIGLALVGWLFGNGSHAAEGESRLRIFKNKKFEESHTLTDAKLKAESGSLSRVSGKLSLSYFGPTFGDFSAPDQPNPDGTVATYSQAFRGSVSARYRLNPDSAVSAGTGISINHPFHGWDRTDVNNPFLSYDFSSRFGKLQMRNSPGIVIATVPDYTEIGEIGGVNWNNSLVYRVSDSKFALSFDSGFDYWIYKRTYRPGSRRDGGDGRAQQYTIAWYPGFKYNFRDYLQMYSSMGFQLYNPREAEDLGVLWNRTVSIRLGLGYSHSRDFYFAPYIQGFVENLSWDMTTINMTGVFSVL